MEKFSQKSEKKKVSPAHIAGAFAAALGATQPAMAETPTATEPIGDQATTIEMQTNKSLEASLSTQDRLIYEKIRNEYIPRRISKLQKYVDKNADETSALVVRSVDKSKQNIANLYKYKDNPNYIYNILLLAKAGMNPSYAIARIDINNGKMSDPSFVKDKLSSIPAELIGTFTLTDDDFEEPKYNTDFYNNPEFRDVIADMNALGIKLDSPQIHKIIELRNSIPEITKILKSAIASLGISDAKILIQKLAMSTAGFDILKSRSFVKNVTRLRQAGFGMYTLFPFNSNHLSSLTLEKINSDEYIEFIIGLKKNDEYVPIEKFDYNIVNIEEIGHKMMLLNGIGVHANEVGEYENVLKMDGVIKLLERFKELNSPALSEWKMQSMLKKAVSKDILDFFINTLNIRAIDTMKMVDMITLIKDSALNDEFYRRNFVRLASLSEDDLITETLSAGLYDTRSRAAVNLQMSNVMSNTPFSLIDDIILEKYLLEHTDSEWSNIKTDVRAFEQFTEDNQFPNFVAEYLKEEKDGVYTKFVIKMNPDNEGTTLEQRLVRLNGLDAKTKLTLLAEHGQHGTASTQALLYDGYHIHDFEHFADMNEAGQAQVLERYKDHLPLYFDIKKNYGDAYNFIIQANPTPKQFGLLVGTLADMGEVESFFNLIGATEQQSKVVKKYLLDIESSTTPRATIAGLVELLSAKHMGTVKNIAITISSIESEIARLQTELTEENDKKSEKKEDAVLWYKLILASHYQRLSGITNDEDGYAQAELAAMSDTSKQAVETYGDKLPLFERIPEERLFTNGVHLQYNPFFNNLPDQKDNNLHDRDGHNSLHKTVEYYGGSIQYTADGHIASVRDETGARKSGRHFELRSVSVDGKDMQYVLMSQTKGERSVVIIMNSPKLLNKEIIAFYKHIQQNPVVKGLDGELITDVHGFKLRGHGISSITDTGAEVFKNMRTANKVDIPLASYGSCSGNKHGIEVAKISPSSLYSGFTSTGMAYVNLNLQRGEINFMLEHKYYDTKDLQQDADERFKGYSARMQSGYKSFRWAHQNIPQKVFVAFDWIKAEQQK